MKIAVIGSGIAGLTSAYYLSREHQVSVFEKNDYIGGHTSTSDVKINGSMFAIDTGFIVFNDKTYPRFKRLLSELKVAWRDTEMSFSVRDPKSGLEFNGHNLNTLFAQRKNLLSLSFYRLLQGILKFNTAAKNALEGDVNELDNMTLSEFLTQNDIPETVSHYYLLPMVSAIWSASLADAKDFPLGFFLRFFDNHGLLNVSDRPQWHTLIGGSRAYIPMLTEPFKNSIRLNSRILSVKRQKEQVVLFFSNGDEEYFDEVIFACHSDQALPLIDDATEDERRVLGAIKYCSNEVVLHTDESLLPNNRRAWASWNYLLREGDETGEKPSSVTYNMNILQGLQCDRTVCVTLNNTAAVDPDEIIQTFNYDHPQYSVNSLKARAQRDLICGKNNTHFVGAYWYNGFHEDGVRSAIDVVNRFNTVAIENS
ncbi:NAD(P)/FAD-dependent oxidoreductase [Idiomarina sp. HP20-50]|uniref:NAD(P)/FAD-dependent oxidoreductase n=1 Tax=Idiomarina sp. HP20-50 TaxID=3070813 RepID=UPI00294ABC62|nr:FAD-dependent oxidoreductase [Idiomarina sp. HP20-50]MDV6315017.1 FAD-dependent oxidoreductase [Idiomarina sp. HP20-50]